mgnify:CR=1 FL=1
MLADALQYVDEIVVRIDFMQPTGRNQALDDADMLGAELGPAEHPVFSTYGNRPQRPFEVVGIDRHIRVGQEHLQCRSSLVRVDQRLGQRVAR